MEKNKRIGVLLFLYNRNELSPEEQSELMDWRGETPDNEKLFNQLTDPDYIRTMMTEVYVTRENIFEKLRQRFPYLSEAKLSDADTPFDDSLSERHIPDEETMINISEDEYLASGVSRVEYWADKVGRWDSPENDLDEEEETDAEIFDSVPEEKDPEHKKRGHYFKIFWRAACVLAAGILLYYLIPLSLSLCRETEFASVRSLSMILEDMHRGYLAGSYGIKIEDRGKAGILYHIPEQAKSPMYTRDSLFTPSGGGRFSMKLPDGSTIWLNTKTGIIYPENLTQDPIRIEVRGEAFFEIAASTKYKYVLALPIFSNPFSVEHREKDRRWGFPQSSSEEFRQVILPPGIRLNVMTYHDEPSVTATVLSGSLSFPTHNGTAWLHVNPGQQLQITDRAQALIPSVDTAVIDSWKNDTTVFRGADIKTIMRSIARWYNVNIIYQGTMPDKTFDIRIPPRTVMREVLSALEQQGLHFTILEDNVTVSSTSINPKSK